MVKKATISKVFLASALLFVGLLLTGTPVYATDTGAVLGTQTVVSYPLVSSFDSSSSSVSSVVTDPSTNSSSTLPIVAILLIAGIIAIAWFLFFLFGRKRRKDREETQA